MFSVDHNTDEVTAITCENSGKRFSKQVQFLESCWKMCPRCGNILRIGAKGCDNCLLQFDTDIYGLRRFDDK